MIRRRKRPRAKSAKRAVNQAVDLLIKEQMLEKYGAKCLRCGKTKGLAASHILPKGKYPRMRFELLNLIPLWIFDGSKAASALSKLERAVVLLISAALGYALGEWVFGLVALGMGIRLFTHDAPPEHSNATAAYFVAVLTALAMVIWLVPGHGNGLR